MSESSNNDELISQFMAFTGTSDADKASSYLEMSGNDVETAVGLFLEHEPNVNANTGTSRAPLGGNDDEYNMDDDMDRPRRGRGRAGNNNSSMMMDDDGVRAPDQTRTMRLMDDDSHRMMGLPPNLASMMMMGHNPTYDLMTAMMDEHDTIMTQQQQTIPSAFASSAAALTSINARALLDAAIVRQGQTGSIDATTRMEEKEHPNDNDGDDYLYDDDDEEEENDEGRSRRHVEPPRLSDMFAPPLHLMHQAGGFQGARTMAKDTKRWLLVNLQRDAEFACHALNRDVWRDELVENLIREGFIFWQQMDSTPEGRTFSERYQVHDYPHISFIDPRTGRLMWRKEGWTQQNALTPDTFAEIAMDFCSRNSFDRPPQAPRPPVNASTTAATTPAKRMHEMSEEEQLQAAMQASMTEAGAASSTANTDIVFLDDSDDENDNTAVQIVEDAKPKATAATQDEVPTRVSLNDELQAYILPEEPTAIADVSRIQFRMVDSKRVVRKFSSSDPVRAVYAFVAQTTEEARTTGREFVLMAGYPPIDLLDDIDRTIGDVRLNNEVITVRWK